MKRSSQARQRAPGQDDFGVTRRWWPRRLVDPRHANCRNTWRRSARATKKRPLLPGARHEELFGARAIKESLEKFVGNGFSIEHCARQDKPLFEVIKGGAKPHVGPLFSIPEILSVIKEVRRRGLAIKRFKGLGEMNPHELFETTMNPARRKLRRIDLTGATEAEEMFTKLMGGGSRAAPTVHRGQCLEREESGCVRERGSFFSWRKVANVISNSAGNGLSAFPPGKTA
jgi:hypothetical protein